MRHLLAVAVLVGLAAAAAESSRADRLAGTCDDCQVMVGRFIEASKDAEKRAAVQSTLNVVCGYVPRYSAECKVLVKNIARVVAKMEPYMDDRRAVCRRLRLCDAAKGANAEIAAVAKLWMLAAKQHMNLAGDRADKLCHDCRSASIGIAQLISEKHRSKNTLRFVKKNICANVGRHQKMCDAAATELIPAFFTDMNELFRNSKQACASMGLCPVAASAQYRPSQTNLGAVLSDFWSKGPKTQQGDALECFTCEVETDVLLDELRKPASCNNIASMIRDDACPILPEAYLLGCQDFLNLYAPTVVYMTVQQMDSHEMCIKQGKCPNDTTTVQQKLQGFSGEERAALLCHACESSAKYAREAAIEPAFVADFVAGVQNFACSAFPGMYVQMCETMVAKFAPKIVKMVVHGLNEPGFCSARGFC